MLAGLPAALAQPLAGDWAGKVLARTQPAKLAALEGHFETETIGVGVAAAPCDRRQRVRGICVLVVRAVSTGAVAAVAQVALILWGWALAQYPYAIRPHLTLAESAAPENVLVLLLQVLGVGAVLLVPSLLYLFGIFGPRGHGAHGEQSSQS